MKVEYINPFVASTRDLFKTMLNCEAERGEVGVVTEGSRAGDLSAMIGLSGDVRGTVVLGFPIDTALKVAGRMLSSEMQTVDEEVIDAISEAVNIVAGGAKAKFNSGGGPPIALGLPVVVQGGDYNIDFPSKSAWLDVPFTSELGPFALRITFESAAAGTARL